MDYKTLERLRRNEWVRATAIRLVRTFLTTILGAFTADTLATEVDWKTALITAGSATLYVLLLCIVAGLPEVDDTKIYKKHIEKK